MENHSQPCDVCIVCVLPEEVRALLAVVRPYCEDGLEERASPRHNYSYRSASLKNDKGEPLTLHISWLPRYGPQEMTLHLPRVLEECQPRLVIMTGICAGDSQHVQLGDLVVAERTFTYDNGKFKSDELGYNIHEPDTITYQLNANILQFVGLFDDWKPSVTRLKRPFSPSATGLKRRGVRCHIKAMASGSAVRADNPFEDVRAPVRGTVAIDMEGAAFGLVMSRHPQIPWLVVKGISDYADPDKNDVYHDYAARASALYAVSFIQAYVTNERLPRPDTFSLQVREQQSVLSPPQTEPDDLEWGEEVLTACEHAIQLNPTDVHAHMNMGSLLFDLKRYEEALIAYERAVQLDPDNTEAHTGRGTALDGLKRYEEALTAYERAVQLDPSYSLAHRNKGAALYSLKRYEEALIAYECAIQFDPTDVYIYVNKGLLFFDLKRYEEALTAYERAVQLDPDNTEAHTGKGAALYRLKRYEEALAVYECAVQLDPDNTEAHTGKGAALYRLKRYEESLTASERAIQLDPDCSLAHRNKGAALCSLGTKKRS